jgi:hypothetical protein
VTKNKRDSKETVVPVRYNKNEMLNSSANKEITAERNKTKRQPMYSV